MAGRSRKLVVSGSTLLILFAVADFAAAQVAPEEIIDAEELAARCDSGEFTLMGNLRVEGGKASLGACFITVGSFRLVIQNAEFSISGPFNIAAQPDGELNVEDSQFVQSQEVREPLHIIFRPHQSRLENTVLDFVGLVTVGTGPADDGRNIVQNCRLRSREAKIHIDSGGLAHRGRTAVRDSALWASEDISIRANVQVPHGRGEVRVERNTLVSQGTITIDTGEDGRTRVLRNGSGIDGADKGRGIYSVGATKILSGAAGKTRVDDNRLLANESLEIASGERTTVTRNNFSETGSVFISGPRCLTRDNIPEVHCSLGNSDKSDEATLGSGRDP